MLTDGEVKLLREIAQTHLGYLQLALENSVDREFIGIQGDDAIEDAVLELLTSIREEELRDPEFNEPFDQLLSTLTEKSGSKDNDIKRLLSHELDSFAVRCGQYPGPNTDLYPELSFEWDIRFDEQCFKDMIEEIDQQVSSGQLHRPIAKVKVGGSRFESSFKIDDLLRYSSGHNRFVLTCPEEFQLERDKNEIRKVFRRLSATLKLIYGLNLSLGELRIVQASENGYNEVGLGSVDARSSGGSPNQRISPASLIQIWPDISERIKTTDRSVDTLLVRLRDLDARRETDDFLIDLMTCFEVLFSDSVEIRFKLASRAAAFLGLMGISGSYSVMLQAYKSRSELVHGSTAPTEEELSRLEGIIPLLQTYLRAAVLARLFFIESKQVFIGQLDVVVRHLLDPHGLAEADKDLLQDFKGRIDTLAKIVMMPR